MSFIGGQTKGADGSTGPAAHSAKSGSEGSLRSIVQSAALTPADIVPHRVSSLLTSNTNNGNMDGGSMVKPTGNSASIVPLNFENNTHNLILPKH
jgi:hypothetical protein